MITKEAIKMFCLGTKNSVPALTAVTLSILLVIGPLTANAQDAIYVTKSGSPDPDGSVSKPYHVVESGIARTLTSSATTVKIGLGKYYETFTVGTPVTLEANSGVVTIGKLDYQASTTLDIITLNTHLAGDQAFMPSWQDCARSNDIADRLKAMPDKPDVVAFQEIWDEDYFFDGNPCLKWNMPPEPPEVIAFADPIIVRSGYCPSPGDDCAYADHGEETDCLACANSGLAIMSRHPMANWFQFFWGMAIFGYCSGSDCMAGKGWVLTEIEKDGFKIWIVNLHTDAGESLSDRQARKNQLTKLRFNLIILRQTFPHHVLFVMGDFNIYDHKDQYRKFLIDLLGQGEAGGRDADRNSPGFTIGCEEDCEHWTYSTDNDLAWHFDDESPSGRLDYIFYFPSWDGSVEVLPTYVNVLPFRGRTLSEDDVTTNESSDHWAVHGKFKLIRR